MEQHNTHPLISIVIPLYNSEIFIAETLHSVMSQTLTDFELIVVNDGSTDHSVEIVRKLCPSARIVEQPNLGTAAARNYGISIAKGRWVTFLDNDDLWHARRLEILINFLNDHQDCLAVATTAKKFCIQNDLKKIKDIGEWVDISVKVERLSEELVHGSLDPNYSPAILKKMDKFNLLKGNYILSMSVLIDRQIILRAGMFPPNIAGVDDYHCWINVSSITPIWFLDCPTYFHRVHSSSVSRTTDMILPEIIDLLSHWYGGQLKPHINELSMRMLLESGEGYKRWLFTELITKSVHRGELWKLRAGMCLAYFLIPNIKYRMELRLMILKEYIKKWAGYFGLKE